MLQREKEIGWRIFLEICRTMNIPFNPMPDGTCRTIKEQYHKNSLANFIRGCIRSHGCCRCSGYGRASRTDGCMTRMESLPACKSDTIAE